MIKQILITTITLMSLFNSFGQEKKGDTEFKSNNSESKAVFTCNHVINDKSPILYVERDSEGDWQFLCGSDFHNTEDAKVISLKQALQLDKTLNDLLEIPNGAGATRKFVGGKWHPFKA